MPPPSPTPDVRWKVRAYGSISNLYISTCNLHVDLNLTKLQKEKFKIGMIKCSFWDIKVFIISAN